MIDADLLDLGEIERRARDRINWDGGRALPPDTPPEAILALVRKVRELRKAIKTRDDENEARRRREAQAYSE